MKKYYKYFYSLLISLFILIVLSLIINLLYYYDVISTSSINYFKIMIIIISFFISGFILGKKTINKGYLEGIKLSIITIIIMILLSIILHSFKISNILYYLITSISIIFGSMIGITKKK